MRRRWFWEALTQLLVTAAVMAVSWFSPWSGVDPSQWGDLAVGLGLRPPERVPAGWWRWVVRLLAERQSLAELEQALRLAGTVGIGLITFQVFGLLDRLLPYGLRVDLRERTLGRLIVNLVLVLGTLSFVVSDIVWRSCQGAGALTVEIVATLLVVRLVYGFLIQGGNLRVIVASALLGLMVGDGLFGVFAFLVVWGLVMYVAFSNPDAKVNPLADPGARHRLVLPMTLVFVTLATTMLIVNYRMYGDFGGVRRAENVLVDFVLVVFGDMYHVAKATMSPLGWVFAVLFAVSPAVFAYAALPKVMTDDRLPSRRYALAMILAGLVAWSQLSPYPVLWWQGWFASVRVYGDWAKVVMLLLNTVTLVWAFETFFLTAAFLNFRRVVGYQYEDASSATAATRAIGAMTRFNRGQRALALVLLVAAIGVAWPYGRQQALGRMRAVIDDYCREVVRECDTATVLLTDGPLDVGVELAAAREGLKLTAVSMLSGDSAHEVSVRQRAAVDGRELELLERGAGDALAYWRTEATNRLSSVAMQFGFARRVSEEEAASVALSGLVGLLGGADRAAASAGVERGRRLGDRIVEICEQVPVGRLVGGSVTELFRFVQWRVSQMCRVRTAYADSRTWGEGERRDEALNARLDDLNPVLVELKGRLGERAEAEGLRLAPEEGLVIALRRADFRLAKTFAETVVRKRPRDVRANFALGMYYLVCEEYRSSVPFFERVLATKGEDATVLNNLATVYDKLGDRKRAFGYAERAHKVAPDNQVILRNFRRLKCHE